jgi:hypothetical protein
MTGRWHRRLPMHCFEPNNPHNWLVWRGHTLLSWWMPWHPWQDFSDWIGR